MLKKSNKNLLNTSIIKGIPNLGNTCYSSVMLQLLFSCSDIIKIIDSYKLGLLFNNNQMSTLKSLITDYFYSNRELVNRITLRKFYESFGCPLSQQDPAEYLRNLLDVISTNNYIYELTGIDILTKDTYSNKIISKLTRYSILYIHIPQNLQKNEYDFETDLWDNYFNNTEELIASTKNKKGNDIIFNRNNILSCNPKYFFINIKRYHYTINGSITGYKKNNNINNIWLKKKIIIDKWNPTKNFTPETSSSNNNNPIIYKGKLCITYKLIAFGVHIGKTINGGHWISFKLINGEWFSCNDTVTRIETKVFIKKYLKKSSLLLYEKIKESVTKINCKNNNKNENNKNENKNNENENENKNNKNENKNNKNENKNENKNKNENENENENNFNKSKIEKRDKYMGEYKKKIVNSVYRLLTPKIKENMIKKGFNPNNKIDIFNYKWHRNIKLNNDNLEGMKLLKLNPVKRTNYIKFQKYKNKQFKKLENIQKEFEKKRSENEKYEFK